MEDDDNTPQPQDYPDALSRTGVSLGWLAERGALPQVLFRDEEIARVLGAIDRGRSVLLVGPPGSGKTAVLHGVAQAMVQRDDGDLRQMSTADIMAGTRYIGEWQTKLDLILRHASRDSVALYITDISNLPTVGSTIHDKSALLDAIVPKVRERLVQVVGEATDEVVHGILNIPQFRGLFERIPITPLSPGQVITVIRAAHERRDLDLDDGARTALVQVTTRFSPNDLQPRPALQLLQQVADYREQKESIGEPAPINASFVEKVFSVYSGLPRFVVSRNITMPAAEIRRRLQERIVGQEEAIEAIVEVITLYKSGLHDPSRPIGTLLFVGPTGVGKTEVARALAHFLYGSEKRMLRFDLSEYKDYHAFDRLIGDPTRPDRPARLTDPVRAQPFQVVLFDELEKGHPNVADLLLQLLDEGRLTPSRGAPVDFRNTIVIATTNVGAETARLTPGFDAGAEESAFHDNIQRSLKAEFRPEFLNRFQHIVVFHQLSRDQLRSIATLEVARFITRDGIVDRDLVVDVDPDALDLAIERGFDPQYGARALRREIQRNIVLPIATALMERATDPHTVVRVVRQGRTTRVRFVETEAAREIREARDPIALPDGRKMTREQISDQLAQLRRELDTLTETLDEAALHATVRELDSHRQAADFWSDPARAARVMRDLDRNGRALDRIHRLRSWLDETIEELEATELRRDVERIGHAAIRMEAAVRSAQRELVTMGDTGYWDAIVEIRPLGGRGSTARDLLTTTYRRWARHRRIAADWVRHPVTKDEPAMLTVQGPFAAGYLAREAGLHRVREDDVVSVARVVVAPWLDEPGIAPSIERQRALKIVGVSGEPIRSRIECAGGLVLQNERSLAENRDLAGELASSWAAAPPPSDQLVRRYDLSPLVVRDQGSGITTGKRKALEGKAFHDLLCARLDSNGE